MILGNYVADWNVSLQVTFSYQEDGIMAMNLHDNGSDTYLVVFPPGNILYTYHLVATNQLIRKAAFDKPAGPYKPPKRLRSCPGMS